MLRYDEHVKTLQRLRSGTLVWLVWLVCSFLFPLFARSSGGGCYLFIHSSMRVFTSTRRRIDDVVFHSFRSLSLRLFFLCSSVCPVFFFVL
jgi:hypothetical protein